MIYDEYEIEEGLRHRRELAAFLRLLPRESFDYSQIAKHKLSPVPSPQEAISCGTVACAIGWMPAVWPQDWRWDGEAVVPLYRESTYISAQAQRAAWFAMSMERASHIFFECGWGMYNIEARDIAWLLERSAETPSISNPELRDAWETYHAT